MTPARSPEQCREVGLAEMAQLLKQAQTLVLCSHVSPDGDTLGSATALAQALRKLGKTVLLSVDDDIPQNLQFIPCAREYRRFAEGETVEGAAALKVAR